MELTTNEKRAMALSLALQAESSHHNRDCWPVCAFDGKDASISRLGCRGIWFTESTEVGFELHYGAYRMAERHGNMEWQTTDGVIVLPWDEEWPTYKQVIKAIKGKIRRGW